MPSRNSRPLPPKKPPKNPLVLAPDRNTLEALEVYKTYPDFPWIPIADVHDGSAYLIAPMSDVALMEQVKVGREQLAPCLEHNIEDMDYFCRFKWDFTRLSWQHQLKDDDNMEWLEFGISDEVDNWGMFADEERRRVDAKGNVVTTAYDGILQVLESLEVGTGQAGSGYWTQRTVSPIVHPNGPNILIRSEQGRDFERMVKGKAVEFRPTDAVIQNFYNIFDGVIIMDKSPQQANLPKGPGKRRYDWAVVTWNQWRNLHDLPKQSKCGALSLTSFQAFPNYTRSMLDESVDEKEGFQKHHISGRPPGEKRATLEFYQQLSDDNTQAVMVPWLHYIICHGDCVTDQVVSIVLRCLRARDENKAKHGKGPVWGWHETFQIGHWAFNALLSTELGQNITWFLAKRKDPHMLGHLMLESVTVFVTDSLRTVKNGGARQEIVKWPVLIWKVVRFDERLLDLAKCNQEYYVSSAGNHMMDPDDAVRSLLPSIEYPRLKFAGPPARLSNGSSLG